MYHPHSDEMVQMAMGMMGMFVVHRGATRNFAASSRLLFIMSAYTNLLRQIRAGSVSSRQPRTPSTTPQEPRSALPAVLRPARITAVFAIAARSALDHLRHQRGGCPTS